jgi:superfamily II DNA or RNA helicase
MSVAVGALVRARGREWVVQPGSDDDFLLLQPLGGGPDDVTGVFSDEGVEPATFPLPGLDDVGDAASTDLLRTALRVGFTSSAGPFRSLARLAVSPRSYQYVPLLMALKQEVVRLLVADDVGIGKTIEAGLITAELLAQGTIRRFAVLCSPALAEQWHRELRDKFGLDTALVLTGTVRTLERDLMLNESLFERHPYVIISSDFIKSDRRRHEFLQRCPELVIVDEAHNYVAAGGQGGRSTHQRYELLRGLAANPARHLILTTATPHSGDDEAFVNLIALCEPKLRSADLGSDAGRRLLAHHLVQRRRADIRIYLDQSTPFPTDRETRDVAYNLAPLYRDLFDDVLAFAREQVSDGGRGLRGRVRYWSALALLRALASSPVAAAATLRTRAEPDTAATEEEADRIGRAGVLDGGDQETLEGMDATPGARLDDHESDQRSGRTQERRRLLDFARRADALTGPDHDRKLAVVTKQVAALLADGYAPIVFCRFLHTADYVAEHLASALGTRNRPVHVAAVTGRLPPTERERRIAELVERGAGPGDGRVLIATDCLSEGVNLQEAFSAVVHYDLAWNPVRHEQREGRVDRYGQRRSVVRAVTLYGRDNGIDEIVLDVLIRKHRVIAKTTGVAVPVPGDGTAIVDALAEGLLLRRHDAPMLPLDLRDDVQAQQLDAAWRSAAEREKQSRTRYAQLAIKPEEVAAEVADVVHALGATGDIETFVTRSLRALGVSVTPTEHGLSAHLAHLPPVVRASLPVALAEPLPLRSEPPADRGGAALVRTDPTVQALARYVLESALDPVVPRAERPARRSGVLRSAAVSTRTTVLLVRLRFQLTLPTADGTQQLVAEDARVLAFEGSPQRAIWLADRRAEELLDATPSGNVAEGAALHALEGMVNGLEQLMPYLDEVAAQHADRLLASHRRVRAGAGTPRRGLAVTPQQPVDVLSIQVLLPGAQQ